jgi:hypothetical protein
MRLLGLALAVVLLLASRAEARRESSLRYPYSLVWTTAVRMVRVDYESPITEKDKDEGYFLFQFAHAGKEYPGSFEIIPGDDESDARVVVQIPAMPSYFEQMLIDRLERKLKQEHGAPREKVVAPPPSEKKPEVAPKEGESPEQPAAPKEDVEKKP